MTSGSLTAATTVASDNVVENMAHEVNSEVVGVFTHPVIDASTKDDDPWQRDFNVPPMFDKTLVTRPFPLINIRPTFESNDYSPQELLKSHGFAAIKHRTSILDHVDVGRVDTDDEELKKAINDVYVPEMTEVMQNLLGTKIMQVNIGIIRKGKTVSERYEFPKVSIMSSQDKVVDKVEEKPALMINKLGRGAPIRVPHLDQTPLGARQGLWYGFKKSHEAAIARGVFAAEEDIIRGQPYKVYERAAEPLLEQHYNDHKSGKLGPRHALFSIWRPLRKVERDPLALAPRKEVPKEQGELVYWPYENKVKGEVNCDDAFLKEFAMLGVKNKERPTDEVVNLKWYYLPRQDTDEVLIIKQYDSAALGPGAQHAAAPWHASPDVGDVFGDAARESLEIRMQVFW